MHPLIQPMWEVHKGFHLRFSSFLITANSFNYIWAYTLSEYYISYPEVVNEKIRFSGCIYFTFPSLDGKLCAADN